VQYSKLITGSAVSGMARAIHAFYGPFNPQYVSDDDTSVLTSRMSKSRSYPRSSLSMLQ
jgi:hypothetical protein